MQIRVGLKTGDLLELDHSKISLSSSDVLIVKAQAAGTRLLSLSANSKVDVTASGSSIILKDGGGAHKFSGSLLIEALKPISIINISSAATARSSAKPSSHYRGQLQVTAKGNAVRLVLLTDLEQYVQGVLQSEVPSYFKLEAMKAQAVLARTYGLRPRLPHGPDGFDVCDSFLHCQAFYGVRSLTGMQRQAITSTKNQLLMYEGKPALAMFSACAGGHTENYENAFSDPITNAFPPPAIPYLKGVPEGSLPAEYPTEAGLRALYAMQKPKTDDSWSPTHFKWRVTLSADALEAHMHHIIEQLRKDPQFAPFIKSPKSGKFGHIKSFAIGKRGVAGTAIDLTIHTSEGDWIISKELTIRSAFENPEAKLKRLRSARMFFDQTNDSLGLLSKLTISGFGSGHGVGLQQIGAQGLAEQGKSYKEILEHYYHGATVGTIVRRP